MKVAGTEERELSMREMSRLGGARSEMNGGKSECVTGDTPTVSISSATAICADRAAESLAESAGLTPVEEEEGEGGARVGVVTAEVGVVFATSVTLGSVGLRGERMGARAAGVLVPVRVGVEEREEENKEGEEAG